MANPVFTMFFAGCVCFTMIHLMSALNVDIPEALYEVPRGGSITIQCLFKPQKVPIKSLIVTWLAKADNPNDPDIDILAYYFFDNGGPNENVDVGEMYAERATHQQNITKGVANLTLKAVTSNDNRVFECKVQIPGDSTGKLKDTTRLVVLVAPSKPICTIQGTPEFFHNITLNCRSEEGTPAPEYKWQRYDFTDKPQPNPLRTTEVNGVLSLYNISTDTDGYYVCESKNKVDSAKCNMTLAVRQASMNIASTAGIIGGCVAALLLLLVIICCCCRRRNKKDQSEEYSMGDADEYTDKEPHLEEHQGKEVENRPDRREKYKEHSDDRRDDRPQGPQSDRQSDRYDDRRNDRYDDRRSDRYDDRYDDRQSDRYDDRRNDRYDDRQGDRYDDRQGDRYDDRQGDRYDDRQRDRYDDRQSDRYDDRRNDRYADRQGDRYDDRQRDRYDDRRRDYHDEPRDHVDDRRDRRDYPDNRDRPPSAPPNKPTRA